MRENIDSEFKDVYAEAVSLAEKVGAVPSMPRVAARQQHRHNVPRETPEEYFRINTAIPFIDHVQESLDAKFTSNRYTNIKPYVKLSSIYCHFFRVKQHCQQTPNSDTVPA